MRTLFPAGLVFLVLATVLPGCGKKAAEENSGDTNPSPLLVNPRTPSNGANPAFILHVDPTPVKLSQGGKVKLTVTADRKAATAAIPLELRNLPAGVTAASATIPAGETTAEIELRAAADAPILDQDGVVVQGKAGDQEVASAAFTVRVQQATAQAPFELKVDPTTVKVVRGGTARILVTATRSGDFQAPISLELGNLPARVTATKAIIPTGKTTADVDVTAADDAAVADKADVTVLGMATDTGGQRVVSPTFTLSVQPRLGSYTLKAEPLKLRVPQGGKATLRVTAARYDNYSGPINVEVRNLPAFVTAPKAVINDGKTQVSIDVSADTSAAIADKSDVNVVGTTSDVGSPQVVSPNFTVSVQKAVPPFTVTAQPSYLKLLQGGTAQLTVSITRSDSYQGPIQVELQHLPAHVTASSTTIPAGQTQVQLEVRAANNATLGDKPDVNVRAYAAAVGNQPQLSPSFTVSIAGKPAKPPKGVAFELKVSPGHVKLAPGATAKIQVAVVRKDSYQGPISVELRHLPTHVTASKLVIPSGQNSGEIDLHAAANAAAVDKGDVEALGTALAANNQEHASPQFMVSVHKKKK